MPPDVEVVQLVARSKIKAHKGMPGVEIGCRSVVGSRKALHVGRGACYVRAFAFSFCGGSKCFETRLPLSAPFALSLCRGIVFVHTHPRIPYPSLIWWLEDG